MIALGAKKASSSQSSNYIEPPAQTAESREQQMISLSVNLAEKQLREGTASSQIICHYLKLGSMKERREREKLEEEIKLLRAKTEELQTAKHIEELYSEAIQSFGLYSGRDNGELNDESEDVLRIN